MDERIAEIVAKYGWYAASVGDADPPFLYTIGLMETCKHPEFIIFGLDSEDAYALFSGLISDIRGGRRFDDNGVNSISLGQETHSVGFRKVHSTQHSIYLGFAMGYMRHIGQIGELEAMQVFWPDHDGKFPFDSGCDLNVFRLQPRLDIALTSREVREFERRWE